MADESCPLTAPARGSDANAINAMLAMKRIAVIGMSDNPDRAGHYVPAYLIDHGFDIVPVNPRYRQILGRICYAALKDVPGAIDAVLVFRSPEFCGQAAQEAADAGARGLWLQTGIVSAQARQTALAAGLWFVEDRCMMVEARRGT